MKKLFILTGVGVLSLTAVLALAGVKSNALGLAKAATDGEYTMSITHDNATVTIDEYNDSWMACGFNIATKTPTNYDFATDPFNPDGTTIGTYFSGEESLVLSAPEDALIRVTATSNTYYAGFNIQFSFFDHVEFDVEKSYVHYSWNYGGTEGRKTEYGFSHIYDTDNTYSIQFYSYQMSEGNTLTIEKIYLAYVCK